MNMHIADEHDHANCTWGYLTADRSSTLEVCGGGKVNKYGKNRQISAKISYIRGGSITQIWSILTIFIHKYPPLQDIKTSGFRVWIRHLPEWSWCAAQSWWNTARKTLKVEGETSTWGQKNRKKKTSQAHELGLFIVMVLYNVHCTMGTCSPTMSLYRSWSSTWTMNICSFFGFSPFK